MKTKHFVFRGNQRRRPTRETTKLRNLKQNRLSMVAVVTLPPVEMRLQKKWKRRWAVESGLCAYIYTYFFSFPSVQAWFCAWFHLLLIYFIACWSSEASHKMGNIPKLHVVLRCLTLSELGRCQLWQPAAKGWDRNVLGPCMCDSG